MELLDQYGSSISSFKKHPWCFPGFNQYTYTQLNFDKDAKKPQLKKGVVWNGAIKTGYTSAIRFLPLAIHKNQLKTDQIPKCKTCNYEISVRKHGRLQDLGVCNDFLAKTWKSTSNKSKTRQMTLYPTQKLLHSWRYNQ